MPEVYLSIAASTTYVSTTAVTTVAASTTATVTLGSLIGVDALTVMFGLFGGFVALAFPLGDREASKKYPIIILQVMAAGMVAAALTELGLSYVVTFLNVTHEGAAKAVAFTLGHLAKWLLPSIGKTAMLSRKTLMEFLAFWISKK